MKNELVFRTSLSKSKNEKGIRFSFVVLKFKNEKTYVGKIIIAEQKSKYVVNDYSTFARNGRTTVIAWFTIKKS